MKSFFKKTLLIVSLFVSTQQLAQAQNSKEKFEEISNYYKNKDYDKVLQLTQKVLDNKERDQSFDYFWLSHQVTFLGYQIFSDPNYKLKDEEAAKTFIGLSKDFLDMCVNLNKGITKDVKETYILIDKVLNPQEAIKDKEKSEILIDKVLHPEEAKKNVEKSEISTNEVNDKIVDVISSGEGSTLDLAINNALRKSIEKVFGVFVMSKTEIAYDQLIDDQMATVASGNILSYSIISQTEKNEAYVVTLNAKVSPQNIVLRAAKSGKELELKGNIYYQNILKEEFYKNEEPKLLRAFYEQWSSVKLFDYEVLEGEMYRKDTRPKGESQSYTVGGYYRKDDMIKYKSKILSEFEDSNEDYWNYLPYTYREIEFYQIPYTISIKKNDNYYNFTKAYVQLLYQISIKDIKEYSVKYGIPIVLWGYVYQNLINAIEAKNPYKKFFNEVNIYDVEFDKAPSGQICLKNNDSLVELKAIYNLVLFQSSCMNMTLRGFDGYTLPPSFNTYNSWWRLEKDWDVNKLKEITLPYPHFNSDIFDFSDFEDVIMLLSFTKDELSKLNQKVVFDFNN